MDVLLLSPSTMDKRSRYWEHTHQPSHPGIDLCVIIFATYSSAHQLTGDGRGLLSSTQGVKVLLLEVAYIFQNWDGFREGREWERKKNKKNNKTNKQEQLASRTNDGWRKEYEGRAWTAMHLSNYMYEYIKEIYTVQVLYSGVKWFVLNKRKSFDFQARVRWKKNKVHISSPIWRQKRLSLEWGENRKEKKRKYPEDRRPWRYNDLHKPEAKQ